MRIISTIFLLFMMLPPATVFAGKVVFVKLYVDEEEATRESVWQRRLTDRINKASEIINAYTDVRFSVIGYGHWESDDRLQELSRSLREFEEEVDPGNARIAIGFSSQYKFLAGRNNLGGTRGPMRSHILIRENARIRESELLEVVVHELGHFLCAGHSSSTVSAMRPVVGDGQARANTFRVGFDPINSRILRLIGKEMRDRRVDRFEQLSELTLRELRPLYQQLVRKLPNDPTAQRYLRAVDILLHNRPPIQ
ncbi:MAG: hypothetical protein AAF497_18365, partial [Planctomycetota bacterium]